MFSISKQFQVVFYVCAEIKCRSRSCEVCCPAVLSLSHLEPITKHQYIDWSKCLSVLLCKHTVGLAVHVLSAWILSGFKSFSSSAPLIVAILAFEPRIWITPTLQCLALGFLSVMCAIFPPAFSSSSWYFHIQYTITLNHFNPNAVSKFKGCTYVLKTSQATGITGQNNH